MHEFAAKRGEGRQPRCKTGLTVRNHSAHRRALTICTSGVACGVLSVEFSDVLPRFPQDSVCSTDICRVLSLVSDPARYRGHQPKVVPCTPIPCVYLVLSASNGDMRKAFLMS